ncbi:ribonuclease P protein subunit p21 [Glossina fuscipes]|uniref:Ribonuclease P protein subunit p21 n=1 Tax=Glossina fuscipes TaxID=7396 RepID=A0A9C5ZHZ6_9MUSC|nr:ribonuclease P protein subunit p21 [Glossina fuscipes]KAI9589638.1 hypothetical protein GQX74_007806 [Glossina fuscipes]
MKRKDKNKNFLQGRECFKRMNFLYQASMLMAGRSNVLSAFYGQLCKNIGKKATLKIGPGIKRDFCKRCSLAQKPGLTSCLSAQSQKRRRNSAPIDESAKVQLVCKLCGYKRHFNINSNYKYWLDNPESVVEERSLDVKDTNSNENKTDLRNEKKNRRV